MLPGRFTFDGQRTLTSVGAIRKSDHPEALEGPSRLVAGPHSAATCPLSPLPLQAGAQNDRKRRGTQRQGPDIGPLRRCAASRYLKPMTNADNPSIKTTATPGAPTAHTKCTRIRKNESYLKVGISARTRFPDFFLCFLRYLAMAPSDTFAYARLHTPD